MKFCEKGRGAMVARVLRLAIKLSQRSYTAAEITGGPSDSNWAAYKRFKRDLDALEQAGIPVIQDGTRYSVDPHFMKRFT